jgi:hypothetical protein
MKFIITETQDKQIRSFVRRLDIANKIISELDPKNICKYWSNTENDALHFSDDIIMTIVLEINDTLNINSYHNKDLYKFLEDVGYYDKLMKFFYKSFESCK